MSLVLSVASIARSSIAPTGASTIVPAHQPSPAHRPSGRRDERDHTIFEIFPKNNLGECLSRLLGPGKHALTVEITVDRQPNEKRPGRTSPAVIRCKIAAGLAQMAVQERANQPGDKAENENTPHAEFGNGQNAVAIRHWRARLRQQMRRQNATV
jgi:hypothetical protein